jgi:predicted acyltransferase
VVFTGGAALLLLALCHWLIDVKGWRRWAVPFVIFGVNALIVFFLSGIIGRLMTILKVSRADGQPVTLKGYIFDNLFTSWLSPINASLFFAVCFVLVWLGLMAILYRRKIFIKV